MATRSKESGKRDGLSEYERKRDFEATPQEGPAAFRRGAGVF